MALSLTTVSEYGLESQGWTGSSDPDPAKIRFPSNTPGPKSKPPDGFFTSTLHPGEKGTSWMTYMKGNVRWTRENRSLWVLEADPEASLIVIDSMEDYRALADAFPQRWDDPSVRTPAYAPDWFALAQADISVNGVHVTDAAVRDATVSAESRLQLSGWDVESTLWMRWSFISQQHIGRIDTNGNLIED
jgi:hypothetical protein